MKFLFYICPILIISCAPPSAFMGNGIFSLGTTQSIGKAAVSTGADYVIKKETGKNKIEHLSSNMLKKNCKQRKSLKITCK
tara:strand:+ start:3333 stop:3575 length:243 start_codon:yes stop_codon:yes gene_type:complete